MMQRLLQFKDYQDCDIDNYLLQMFRRTWLFQSREEQLKRMNTKILCGGVGIGSQIVECLVRESFMNIMLADGDHFEAQNKSRQNCTDADLGVKKVYTLSSHLKNINSRGNYLPFADFLRKDNLEEILPQVDFFINCIDFESEVFLESHHLAKKMGIVEIFPFVVGHYACVIVIDKDSQGFTDFFDTDKPSEIKNKILDMCINEIKKEASREERAHLTMLYEQYRKNEAYFESDPQSCIAVFKVAALVSLTIEKIIQNRGNSIAIFPRINIS